MQWFSPFLTCPSPPLCLIPPPLKLCSSFPSAGSEHFIFHIIFSFCVLLQFLLLHSTKMSLLMAFQKIFNYIFVLCVKDYAGPFLINYACDSMQSQSWWSWWIMHAHLIKSLSHFIFPSSLNLGLFQSLDIFFALYHMALSFPQWGSGWIFCLL